MVGVLGFDCWGVMLGFWGKGVQLLGFGVCGARPSGFFRGLGCLYKNRRIAPEIKMVWLAP